MDSAAWTLFISMALAVIGSALIEVNPSNRRTAG
jgi:hypothetical protein